MKLLERGEPTFLKIRWDAVCSEHGKLATREAILCRQHREAIYLQHPSAQGCRELGDSCDICEGREPRTT